LLEESKTEADASESQTDAAQEEEKKEAKPTNRTFDPEKDAKSWDNIDLGSMLMQNNKKRNIKEAK